MHSYCVYNLKAFAPKKKFQQPVKIFRLCKTGTKCYLCSISIQYTHINLHGLQLFQIEIEGFVIQPLQKQKVKKNQQHAETNSVEAAMPIIR